MSAITGFSYKAEKVERALIRDAPMARHCRVGIYIRGDFYSGDGNA